MPSSDSEGRIGEGEDSASENESTEPVRRRRPRAVLDQQHQRRLLLRRRQHPSAGSRLPSHLPGSQQDQGTDPSVQNSEESGTCLQLDGDGTHRIKVADGKERSSEVINQESNYEIDAAPAKKRRECSSAEEDKGYLIN